MGRKKLILILSILSIFIIGIVFIAIFSSNKKNLKTFVTERKKMVVSIYASGYIDSSDSVIVRSEVSGYVEKIFVRENDEIKKGKVLAIISNSSIKESLRDLEAQIRSIKEKLDENSNFRKHLLHNVEMKKTILESRERDFFRKKGLYQEDLISKEKFDEVKRDYEVAKQDYESQLNYYNDTIRTLKYQIESLQARYNALRAEMEKYYVRSPINGRVLRKFVNEGDYVSNISQSNALFSIGNDKNLETVINVDEEYIPMVKEGMKVLITVDSYPNEIFTGKVKTIEAQSDRTTRTVKVKVDVDYGKKVFLNLTVEANIVVREAEGIFIPESCYKQGFVEIVEGGKRKKVKVEVLPEKYNGYLLVKSGLKEGQKVILQ